MGVFEALLNAADQFGPGVTLLVAFLGLLSFGSYKAFKSLWGAWDRDREVARKEREQLMELHALGTDNTNLLVELNNKNTQRIRDDIDQKVVPVLHDVLREAR